MTASGDQRRDEATWADRVAALDESVARSGIKDLTTHSSGGDLGESEGLEDPELSGVHDCLRLIERVRRCAPGALSRFTSAEGANAPEADALEFPPTIGRFQIRRLLGQGGFGLVYLAHDPDLGRDVALKIPVAESLVSPSMRQRFLREAQAAAILNHPSIAAVYEAGRIGPICFIASEFVDGMTLSEWIAEHRQPWHPREAAHLIDTLAQAVQHAHSRGVLHRDIKPGNILVSPDVSHSNSVQAKLTDFGLAKILDAVPLAQTQTHALLGTPAYMSPEQASGNTRDVGVAADIHGLGVILYQLLTLKSPFERETYMQTLEAVRSCDPVAPRHLEKDIPRDLESICVKCLQKSPADRYSTASELAADLQCFLQGQPVTARPITFLERTGRWCRRNRSWATLLAILAVLVMVITIGIPWAALAWRHQRDVARANLDRAQKAEMTASDNERLAKRRLYEARVVQARQLQMNQMAGHRFESLAAIADASHLLKELELGEAAKTELRSLAIGAMALTDLRVDTQYARRSYDGHPRVDFSPAGDSYVRVERLDGADNDSIVLRDMSTNALVDAFIDAPAGALKRPFVVVGNSGQLLATRRAVNQTGQVRVWRRDHSTPVWEAPSWGDWHNMALDVSPDEQWIAYVDSERRVVVAKLDGTMPPAILETSGSPYSMQFSPQGDQLALNTDRAIQVTDLSTGVVDTLYRYSAYNHGALAWSHDGRYLATSQEMELTVWDVAGKRAVRSWKAHEKRIKSLAYSPDDRLLASSGWGTESRVWDPQSGRLKVTAQGTFVRRFSNDGRWLCWANRHVGRWELAPGTEVTRYGQWPAIESTRPTTLIQSLLGSSESATTEVDEIQYVDLHPNGRWVMVTTESGKVRVFHRDSREELACATELRARVARFRADGQAILLGNRGSLHIVPCHDDGESLSVEVGERRALLDEFKAAPGCGECAWSDDGQRIIFNSTSGQAILLTLSGEVIKKVVVPTAGRLNRVAIDSLGRWAAAGPFQGVETRVYAVADGELLASFETWRALVDFSPCGRWLGINGNAEILIVDTQDWKVRHRIDKPETHWGPLAFDPTGQLLFATLSERDLAVIDVQSGQRVGSINSPEAGRIKSLLYSHEHNVLLVGRDHVEAWDMRRIRDTLAAMGLDW